MWQRRHADTVSSTKLVLGSFRAGRNQGLTNLRFRPALRRSENPPFSFISIWFVFRDERLARARFTGHYGLVVTLFREVAHRIWHCRSVNINKERKKEIILVTNFHLLTPADQAGLRRYWFRLDGFSSYHEGMTPNRPSLLQSPWCQLLVFSIIASKRIAVDLHLSG